MRILEHHPDGTHVEEGTANEGSAEPIFVWEGQGVKLHSLRFPGYAKQVHTVLRDDQEMKNFTRKTIPRLLWWAFSSTILCIISRSV